MEKLIKLRSELSVPKNQFNSFGKYKYRSQEDILEAVKPLLDKYGLLLTITDDMYESNAGRHYIKSTVRISDSNTNVSSTGFAREPENKKGMDESQISGTASSYARKYALNALFLIDDTKDADTDEHHKATNKPEQPKQDKPLDRQKAILAIEDEMQKVGKSMEYRDDVRVMFDKAKTRGDFTKILNDIRSS